MKSWSWACRHATDALVGDVRVGDRKVVADRGVEQVHMLGHDAEHPPDIVRAEVVHVAAADPDRAAVRLPEAQQQVDECRLARPARTDEREALTVRDSEAHVVEDRAGRRVVGELQVPDLEPERRRERFGNDRVDRRSARRPSARTAGDPPHRSCEGAATTGTGARRPRMLRRRRAAGLRGTRHRGRHDRRARSRPRGSRRRTSSSGGLRGPR